MAKEDYKGIWIFAEQQNGVLNSVTLELLAKAQELKAHNGEDITAHASAISTAPAHIIDIESPLYYKHQYTAKHKDQRNRNTKNLQSNPCDTTFFYCSFHIHFTFHQIFRHSRCFF